MNEYIAVRSLTKTEEEALKEKDGADLMFVAIVDTNGMVRLFKGLNVDEVPLDPGGSCSASRIIDVDSISWDVHEGSSRHCMIKHGGSKLRLKCK